jgi:hypothetical protein
MNVLIGILNITGAIYLVKCFYLIEKYFEITSELEPLEKENCNNVNLQLIIKKLKKQNSAVKKNVAIFKVLAFCLTIIFFMDYFK